MQPPWKTVRTFLKKLKIQLPYDPAIPLLDTYPDKTIIQKDTCTSMFIAILFKIAKTWKQPKRPSTDEWIKKPSCVCVFIYTLTHTHTHTHIHNGILLSHKKECNNAICSSMDGLRDYHTKCSNPDKDKYHMISLTCGI